jgi:hypothetical protein
MIEADACVIIIARGCFFDYAGCNGLESAWADQRNPKYPEVVDVPYSDYLSKLIPQLNIYMYYSKCNLISSGPSISPTHLPFT